MDLCGGNGRPMTPMPEKKPVLGLKNSLFATEGYIEKSNLIRTKIL